MKNKMLLLAITGLVVCLMAKADNCVPSGVGDDEICYSDSDPSEATGYWAIDPSATPYYVDLTSGEPGYCPTPEVTPTSSPTWQPTVTATPSPIPTSQPIVTASPSPVPTSSPTSEPTPVGTHSWDLLW